MSREAWSISATRVARFDPRSFVDGQHLDLARDLGGDVDLDRLDRPGSGD